MLSLSRRSRQFLPLTGNLERRVPVSTLIIETTPLGHPRDLPPIIQGNPTPPDFSKTRGVDRARVGTSGEFAVGGVGSTNRAPATRGRSSPTAVVAAFVTHHQRGDAGKDIATPQEASKKPRMNNPSSGALRQAMSAPLLLGGGATAPVSNVTTPSAPSTQPANTPPANANPSLTVTFPLNATSSVQAQPSGTQGTVRPATGGGPNDPTVSLEADTGGSWPIDANDYLNAVGDFVEAIVSAPTGKSLATVIYTVDGGMDKNSYVYDYETGNAEPLDNPIEHDGLDNQYDGLQFFWNSEDRNHTIVVTATYVGGGGGTSNTVNCQVEKPAVISFVDDYNPTLTSRYNQGTPDDRIGLINTGADGSPGEAFSAVVNTPPSVTNHGGEFAILQLVNTSRTFTFKDQTEVTISSNGQYVLDAQANPNDSPYYSGYTSGDYEAGTLNIDIPGVPYSPDILSDSPAAGISVGLYPDGNYMTGVYVNDQFKTYLMYISDDPWGSAAVAISEIQWTFKGNAAYLGPINGDVNQDYSNTQLNWLSASLTPSDSGQLNGGAPDTPFPTWSKNIQDILNGK